MLRDWGNNRVQWFEKNGTFRSKWGSLGNGNGQFNSPAAVAVHPLNGDVYVAWVHWDVYPDGPIDIDMVHLSVASDYLLQRLQSFFNCLFADITVHQ